MEYPQNGHFVADLLLNPDMSHSEWHFEHTVFMTTLLSF
jgi:hypothetical protein